ncbi:MAG: thiamine-phosphate kinase, partial [Methylibium sp.]|nr:thiamine-phosphate kinase [Methylibium sp.]
PRSADLAAQPLSLQRLCTLAGGDDYELVFTAPEAAHAFVLEAARAADVAVSRIGRVEQETGLRLVDADGQAVERVWSSFDHFSA